MNNLTIGQLARKKGIPISTLRFYERIRLLVPERRNHSNYRRYNSRSLEKLAFIQEARRCGLSLSDIGRLFKVSGPAARRILAERMEKLRAKSVELSIQKRRLAGWLGTLDRSGRAAVLPSRNHRAKE